jgi:hypothetical protein
VYEAFDLHPARMLARMYVPGEIICEQRSAYDGSGTHAKFCVLPDRATCSSSANHEGAKPSCTNRSAIFRRRGSSTVVITILKRAWQRSTYRKNPGRGICLAALEMNVPSKSGPMRLPGTPKAIDVLLQATYAFLCNPAARTTAASSSRKSFDA